MKYFKINTKYRFIKSHYSNVKNAITRKDFKKDFKNDNIKEIILDEFYLRKR